jgi:hypothetical protein
VGTQRSPIYQDGNAKVYSYPTNKAIGAMKPLYFEKKFLFLDLEARKEIQ